MPPKEDATLSNVNGEALKVLFAALPYLSGKIPWNEIAEELSITSAAAAQKRFTRLLKANDTTLGSKQSNAVTHKSPKTNGAKNIDSVDSGDDHGAGTPSKMEAKKRKATGEEGAAVTAKKTKKSIKQQSEGEGEIKAESGASMMSDEDYA